MPSPIKKNRKGQFVGRGQKQNIFNLYKSKKHQQPDIKYKEMIESISKEIGIGKRTVITTISEYKNTGQLKSPCKTKIRPIINDKIDDFDKNAIRQKINGFWFRGEIPTLLKIVTAIDEDPGIPSLPRTYLQRILKELNFEYTKRNRNSALTERGDLVVWRQKYIEDIRRYRRDAFLEGLSTGPKNPSGKGKRLIVVHIGSSDGFVEGGLLCFESKKNTADYHDEMNGDTFYEWFCGVLPRLKENSIIVMDNASYHSVKKDPVPTTAWKKDDIINWLKSKDIVFDKPMVKFRLLDKVNEIKPLHNKYVIDEEALKTNRHILRLPPYHCELNPIELAWSVVKNHVKQNNTTFKLNDVKQLLIEGVQKVTSDMWANFVSHTIKEEDKLYEIDFITENMLDNEESHIMTITGDTSSDFSDE
ncbi:uncharacterized protein LOC103311918 [Acyrthosiphon pisum]|uniref:Tc1-like transposase DDE domain-containing protein n=1 Tax=Acyrthosiphon pisum TaxID=7029 RepID=A0A8R2FDX3_ACYPI|nr:uncharacterized protein LOC103311918 [Acyrthosiphon pisum]|eukprot:XP_008189979.1 PREDICTED: uncharacterized protein LOC103311918 [Acyrthosiphon pisum]